ncbi:ethanolamine utilization protein EutN [candidate division KSB3 bacterium]|uniref:Ethanolamine utilization protein EutN n=1 Tax=candidate division KSB3 bacterium TaxID=2044937 RepID=A0A9D5JWB2_9BACT|nr:ethanolamine utilization protein EutN [candidate division KSB3 bacterium]MBD3325479.1 ethanolamine utilization protein EutN [candidate division KSB3 bacterium]
MILGMVVGTVVSSRRADGLEAPKYLLVDPCDQRGTRKNAALVALDLIGAGPGEVVILCQGSAARQTTVTDDRPIDAVIVAIVDLIDERGAVVYQK